MQNSLARDRPSLRELSFETLCEDAVSTFESIGFVCIENWLSKNEQLELVMAISELVERFDASQSGPKAVFKAGLEATNGGLSANQEYFLRSAGNVSYFYEARAIDEEGNALCAKERALNKIGHALHDIDERFVKFSRSAKMKESLMKLGHRKPTPVQSMVIFKHPKIGGEVVAHQDDTFIRTGPKKSTIGVWVALEDCTIENGCLRALAGSHFNGTAKRMYVDHENEDDEKRREIKFRDEKAGEEEVLYDIDDFVPLEVAAGTLVFLHGENVHWSLPNESEKSRLAFSVHYVEGEYEWLKDNWLQRPESFPFSSL